MTILVLSERQWSCVLRRVDMTSAGCWNWLGRRDGEGYAAINFQVDGRVRSPLPHRLIYTRLVGPIPDGLELDHVCRNRGCVNPAHLEPVTHAENCRRRDEALSQGAFKTHCCNGHVMDERNSYVRPDDGRKTCRSCNALAAARSKTRRTEKPA